MVHMRTIPQSEETTCCKLQEMTDHKGGKSDADQGHRRVEALTKRKVKWKKMIQKDESNYGIQLIRCFTQTENMAACITFQMH